MMGSALLGTVAHEYRCWPRAAPSVSFPSAPIDTPGARASRESDAWINVMAVRCWWCDSGKRRRIIRWHRGTRRGKEPEFADRIGVATRRSASLGTMQRRILQRFQAAAIRTEARRYCLRTPAEGCRDVDQHRLVPDCKAVVTTFEVVVVEPFIFLVLGFILIVP
jgi:hypothetical protein